MKNNEMSRIVHTWERRTILFFRVTRLAWVTDFPVLAYQTKCGMTQKGIRRDQINPMNSVLYGATAGYALWGVIYPIDMIKSRMQTDGFTPSTGQKYTSARDCVRKVWRTEGISAFTRGLGPTLIRSPFANGATFLGFEMASRLLYS
ncbi:mitochondrial carrier domain-containing protein [Suillus spraguei]|nr:mitochondrial carrier domain-containing protein [Suillus spraguei]